MLARYYRVADAINPVHRPKLSSVAPIFFDTVTTDQSSERVFAGETYHTWGANMKTELT